jgi:hypothetical protein
MSIKVDKEDNSLTIEFNTSNLINNTDLKCINFKLKDEHDLSMFYICINSLYDDIINLKLKVNIETTPELINVINGLEMLPHVKFNACEKITEHGLYIDNNCIFLPNSLMKMSATSFVDATPEYLKELIENIEINCIVPPVILVFEESEILPKEQIPLLMKDVLSTILNCIDIINIIYNDIQKESEEEKKEE